MKKEVKMNLCLKAIGPEKKRKFQSGKEKEYHQLHLHHPLYNPAQSSNFIGVPNFIVTLTESLVMGSHNFVAK